MDLMQRKNVYCAIILYMCKCMWFSHSLRSKYLAHVADLIKWLHFKSEVDRGENKILPDTNEIMFCYSTQF